MKPLFWTLYAMAILVFIVGIIYLTNLRDEKLLEINYCHQEDMDGNLEHYVC